MNDYCVGIAYGTGYFANDANDPYLVVRNLDRWYVESIAKETGYHSYESAHNFDRDKRNQWVVKAKNIHNLPNLSDLQHPNDFCRAYIELHGIIDMATSKDKKGGHFQKPRLRIYGKEEIVSFINDVLPAKEKKIQYIQNRVGGAYTGRTCAIYYQSKSEISDILNWICGEPKNNAIWKKWLDVLKTD